MKRLTTIVAAVLIIAFAAAPAMAQYVPPGAQLEPPQPPPEAVDNAELIAEVTVECPEYLPPDVLAMEIRGVEGLMRAPLGDPDGDGVFVNSLTLPKYPPGPVDARDNIEPITVDDVRLVDSQGNTLHQWGPVKLDQDEIILPATVSYCDGDGGEEPLTSTEGVAPKEDATAPVAILPATGGPAVGSLLPVSALILGAGVLAFAVLRRR